MKKDTGFYPRVQVDTGPVAAVAQAGGVTLTETVTLSGLGGDLKVALEPMAQAVRDPRPGQGPPRSRPERRVGRGTSR